MTGTTFNVLEAALKDNNKPVLKSLLQDLDFQYNNYRTVKSEAAYAIALEKLNAKSIADWLGLVVNTIAIPAGDESYDPFEFNDADLKTAKRHLAEAKAWVR